MSGETNVRGYSRPVAVLALSALLILGVAGGVVASDQFNDVPDDHPFHDQIGWMADTGISTGYDGGTEFRPNNPVTRQAMAVFMQRLAGDDPDVDPVVKAADSEDSEQLGGRDPEYYVSSSGTTVHPVAVSNFESPNPSRVSRVLQSGRASFTVQDDSSFNTSVFAHPQVESLRFGETQFLHSAEVCINPSEVDIYRVGLSVYQADDGARATPVYQEDVQVEGTDRGCHEVLVDEDDSPTTTEGFQLQPDHFVELYVRFATDAVGDSFEINAGSVMTSSSKTRTNLIVIEPELPPYIPPYVPSDD